MNEPTGAGADTSRQRAPSLPAAWHEQLVAPTPRPHLATMITTITSMESTKTLALVPWASRDLAGLGLLNCCGVPPADERSVYGRDGSTTVYSTSGALSALALRVVSEVTPADNGVTARRHLSDAFTAVQSAAIEKRDPSDRRFVTTYVSAKGLDSIRNPLAGTFDSTLYLKHAALIGENGSILVFRKPTSSDTFRILFGPLAYLDKNGDAPEYQAHSYFRNTGLACSADTFNRLVTDRTLLVALDKPGADGLTFGSYAAKIATLAPPRLCDG